MDEFQKPLDLELWMNSSIIRRQNELRKQFIHILEEVGNAFSHEMLLQITSKSKGFKISKGNDLLGFPYHVLDLIRDFDETEGVNIRLLNWFGHGLFITVQLGNQTNNPIEWFLNLGFSYGLSEGRWDYPDLILNKNLSTEKLKIEKTELGFHHWIKEIHTVSNQELLVKILTEEVKKILVFPVFQKE